MKNRLYEEGLGPAFMRSAMLGVGSLLMGQSLAWAKYHSFVLSWGGMVLGMTMFGYAFYCNGRLDGAKSKSANVVPELTHKPEVPKV